MKTQRLTCSDSHPANPWPSQVMTPSMTRTRRGVGPRVVSPSRRVTLTVASPSPSARSSMRAWSPSGVSRAEVTSMTPVRSSVTFAGEKDAASVVDSPPARSGSVPLIE